MAAAPRVVPTPQQLAQAYARLHKPHWPATLNEALADHTLRVLITGLARGLARDALGAAPARPPARLLRPPRPAREPTRFDARKAAANDRDDD